MSFNYSVSSEYYNYTKSGLGVFNVCEYEVTLTKVSIILPVIQEPVCQFDLTCSVMYSIFRAGL